MLIKQAGINKQGGKKSEKSKRACSSIRDFRVIECGGSSSGANVAKQLMICCSFLPKILRGTPSVKMCVLLNAAYLIAFFGQNNTNSKKVIHRKYYRKLK